MAIDSPQVIQVNVHRVAGHQFLELRSGEHRQPIAVDDGSESAQERRRLLASLNAHLEVCHQMYVADPAATAAAAAAIRATDSHPL